jgi:FtsP/CotA-like multicopper oxidase with cupredoxin domain
MRVMFAAALIVAAMAWGLDASLRAQSATMIQSLAPGTEAGPALLASRMVGSMALAGLPDVVSEAPAAPQGSDAKADALARMMRRTTMAQRKAAAERGAALRAEAAKKAGGGASLLGAVKLNTSQSTYVYESTIGLVPDYFGTDANWAYTPPLRKFVNHLPGLGAGAANELGQYIPVATAITPPPYPGSDYYEIEVSDYTARMHSDLPATKLRGYRDLNPSGDTSHQYLGPIIVATRDKPVRVKLVNNVPTGAAGDLFIPSDTSVMGAGMGDNGVVSGNFSQNRATLHLHGGLTPWISDGTPHQWTAPVGESTSFTPFLKGVSSQDVPDMPPSGAGQMTFYWPNQQSNRLQFYHDHAYGQTRTNVYAGEAAGYLITDAKEQALITNHILPDLGIPLIIQDKTFVAGTQPPPAPPSGEVPSAQCAGVACYPQIGTPVGRLTVDTDPTWDTNRWTAAGAPTAPPWGQSTGSLWFSHVYMVNQNPYDPTGAATAGRWDYGPWFWPPMPVGSQRGAIKNGLVTNPYAASPGQPPVIPGTPNPSLTPESFMDTPLVNGTAYPVLNVDQKAYRFRVLSAGNDRFLNLQIYYAVDPGPDNIMGTPDDVPCNAPGVARCTEVRMSPAFPHAKHLPATTLDGRLDCSAPSITPVIDPVSGVPTNCWPSTWPVDARVGGAPDPLYAGPKIVQIGTEGGFLPAPVEITSQPVTYVMDKRNIVVLNVDHHGLFLGPAERADILVDFTGVPAGSKLILYNDSPAPVPASDPRIDYFTDDDDFVANGGAPSTQIGYGPNIRTIMRFDVGTGTGLPIAPTLATEISSAFGTASDPILVPQPEYNAAYGATFPRVYSSIQANALTFTPLPTLADPTPAVITNFPMLSKAIQELWELDYGRMNATLGVELPFTNGTNQTTVPMGYAEIPTEIINDSIVVGPTRLGDGTQIWKITHNGVDTHAIHVHLFNAQVINRVGWDGAVRMPDANELGWKETIRMSPLEDVIIALRAVAPRMPFGIPVSERPYDISKPANATIDTFDPRDGAAITVPNDPAVAVLNPNLNPNLPGLNAILPGDFGWEYVWHCHILGHEENDMMRPIVFNVVTAVPAAPTGLAVSPTALLTWTDPTPVGANPLIPANLGNPQNEIGFYVQRSLYGAGTFATIGTALANATSYTDATIVSGTDYDYQVIAFNASGNSPASNIASLIPPPAAPTALSYTVLSTTSIGLNWTLSPSLGLTGQQLYRSTNGGAFVAVGSVLGAAVVTATDAVVPTNTYAYYVVALKGAVPSVPSNTVTIPLTIVSLTANRTFPSPAGTSVTWTAAAAFGANPLQYQFWRYDFGTGIWTNVQAYSTSATFTWTSPTAGSYQLAVQVRNAGSVAPYDAVLGTPLFVIGAPLSITSLSPSVTFPSPAGTSITWTATATGGTAPLQYQFWRYDFGTGIWTNVQAYSTTATFTWTSPTAGSYQLAVQVRNAGSVAPYDAVLGTPKFVIGAPLSITSLTPNRTFPSPAGTSITWTATATGGVAPLQYQFWRYNFGTGIWTNVQAYSTTATFTWTSPTAGSYQLAVQVRNAGSVAPYDAVLGTPKFVIAP